MAVEQRWLANHRVTKLWSSPNADAIAFTEVPQFSYFLQLAPQEGSRIFVHYFGNSVSQEGDVFVDAIDLGPIDARPDRPEPEPRLQYLPRVLILSDIRAGFFQHMPKGVVLHGSRSGHEEHSTHQEFEGTAHFALNTELGWNATVGDDEIALHLAADEWGHHARAASDDYLSVELAQPVLGVPISDGQVRAFCWWMRKFVLQRWPDLPLHFPTHAEVEQSGETGHFDGKTDICEAEDVDTANEVRQRIFARLADPTWTV
jgi:hypothetical protein